MARKSENIKFVVLILLACICLTACVDTSTELRNIEVTADDLRLTYSCGMGGVVERVVVTGPYGEIFPLSRGPKENKQPEQTITVNDYEVSKADNVSFRVYSLRHDQLVQDKYYVLKSYGIHSCLATIMFKWEGDNLEVIQVSGRVCPTVKKGPYSPTEE